MKTLSRTLVATALALASSNAAFALGSPEEKLARDRIAAEYTMDKEACHAMKGNARDVCEVEAKGKRNVARAQLKAGTKPSRKGEYDLRMARVDADHAIAKEKCDDLSDNPKVVCVKEAKAAQVAARADARSLMLGASANRLAESDKGDADFAVAKAKCDGLGREARDGCMADATSRRDR